MRARGITYDTGFFNAGTSTREPFDPDVVRREMRVIHDDLHCMAVRITGGDPDRLEVHVRRARQFADLLNIALDVGNRSIAADVDLQQTATRRAPIMFDHACSIPCAGQRFRKCRRRRGATSWGV